ncbi:MAG: RNA 3'-terminal phosphate cyclase [Fimbriimonas sp.]
MGDWLEVDGSYGEGGGQIIRSSVSLAAITGKAVHIQNIRAKRAKPGLQNQHLTAVRAGAEICAAEMRGDAVGSTELFFRPTKKVEAAHYRFDITTAGASTLVLQTVLTPLALAGGASHVTVTGGTHNPMAPPAEYLEFVYLPALARAGLKSIMDSPRNGFYPKGGGQIRLSLSLESGFMPVDFTLRGDLLRASGIVLASNLPETVLERGEATLREFLPESVPVERRLKPSPGVGAAAFAHTEFEGGFGGFISLGEKGKPMEKVAEECGSAFEKWMQADAAVDEHLADQLVLPMALAKGRSRWRTIEVTEHLRTVLWLVGLFVPAAMEIEELGDGSGIVVIEGCGT